MRDFKRIERIMSLIEEIWVNNPNLRFNQLLSNLQREFNFANDNIYAVECYKENKDSEIIAERHIFVDLFNVGDDKFEKFLDNYVKRYS